MGPRKRKDPIASRRRVDDDGEDEELPIEDDDSSIGTLPSDGEHEADVEEEASDPGNTQASKRKFSKKSSGNGDTVTSNGKLLEDDAALKKADFSNPSVDTVAMMSGLDINKDVDDSQAIEFGDHPQDVAAGNTRPETLAERRRREHEEYKKKRDNDPAFVPNRGGFFMHDSRNAYPVPNGFRAGRGRGRGGRGGLPFAPHPAAGVADAPWAHDLHETVADTDSSRQVPPESVTAVRTPVTSSGPQGPPRPMTPPNRVFSRTVQVGTVQLRVFLPQMKEPATFPPIPVHSYTRLPNHRPPLRRDKPVRVSIPEHPPRYIFPAVERSFIFIPRAMRPNQQGFGRTRTRGSFTGYGNFSARNSIFGGSIYSPSVALSRRSSIAREIGREGMASPSGSVVSRSRGFVSDPTKPVVRLPPTADPALYGQYQNQPMPFVANPGPPLNGPPIQALAVPQRPTMQNFAGPIPMHQPRPQKQIAVADIEPPAALSFPPPQVQQQQPFHHQVPASLNGQGYAPDTMPAHARRPSHPSQHGTPLPHIPERAIHAQSFQPAYQYQQPQAFYPQQFATPMYYYAPGQTMAAAAPPFIPGQQYPYMVPATPIAPAEVTAQPGTVAHESNGMVYYYDSSQLAATAPEDPNVYPQMAYAPAPTYVMAPQNTVYYPAQ